ncbi:hypothetical protein [Campylobacter geochelonis]|uniref:TRAM-like protein n=1 Tax=Campylobacter geochelonis TaxID=1780362 RepID=A0A128EEL8_9BACT|nr:hypothetical protein [Campylobacter geochelonis]QKF71877.1 hypothetical protein CGEO_1600 [Campylobacter geochelonis]CZE47066.1 TRAM-like protein [Campylobacter geochelonis]CZE47356.1 TRAM-like protein [Campylobacter geochelonis]CZE50983.1 TRAM-like protein [Campylobacter geochelonis]
MNQKLTEILIEKGMLFKKTKSIELSKFTRSKSYSALFAVDMKSNNTLIFIRDALSRFLQKDVAILEEISNLVADDEGKVIKKKLFFYNSQICSKSLNLLKEKGWSSYAFV